MKIKRTLFFVFAFIMYFNSAQAQDPRKLLQKSWIKVNVENLSETEMKPDTMYTRYTFSGNRMYISYNPGWDDYPMEWSVEDRYIKLGIVTYILQELTDSTFVFYQDGFRKYHLISESKFATLKTPDTTAPFNGETVYLADKHLTARFKNHKIFYNLISQQISSKFQISRKSNIEVRFIVTNNGKVENVRVIQGIMEDYDQEMIRLISKTSGNWIPAQIGNQAVNCEMKYEIKYLSSIGSPYKN